jgi:hypothetical protein
MKIDLLTEEQQDVLRSKGTKIERLQSGIVRFLLDIYFKEN